MLGLLRELVNTWLAAKEGPVVIPTSGGYDSRLLNLLVDDRSRIRAFTYGTSDDQKASLEVVRAAALSRTLGTRWQHIPLMEVHRSLSTSGTTCSASRHMRTACTSSSSITASRSRSLPARHS